MPDERLPDGRLTEALAFLDQAIAAAPDRDGHAFSHALMRLSAVRDEAAARDGRRTEESRRRLMHMNAVLSMILAGHFPLGSPPWDEIKKARGWLAELQAAS